MNQSSARKEGPTRTPKPPNPVSRAVGSPLTKPLMQTIRRERTFDFIEAGFMRSMHEASKARRMALLRKAGAVAQVVVPGSFVVGGFLAENKYVIATGALVAALEAWPKLRKIAKARATRRRHEEMMNDPSNYV